jgi:CheY-like chemotaxis protein
MEKKKILVVDDEQDVLRLLAIFLRTLGYETLTAINGKDGLKKAEDGKPDAILLDYSMPVMDGPEMLQQLKSTSGLKDIPVIMLTARSAPQDITAIHQYDVMSYVIKPFEPTELKTRIEEALGCRKKAHL